MIRLVKTWSEDSQEGKAYLKYNGYGVIKRIFSTDYYICICKRNPNELRDVKIIF